MAGTGLTLQYDDTPVRQALTRLSAFRGSRQHALLDAIGAYGESSTRLRFRTGTGPDGAAWKISRRAAKTGGQTLVMKGRLRNSITHNVLAGDTGVEWGTNVVYGRIHQLGGTIKRGAHEQSVFQRIGRDGAIEGRFVKRKKSTFERRVQVGTYEIKMPARPYLGINAQDKGEIEKLAEIHLDQALRGTIGVGRGP